MLTQLLNKVLLYPIQHTTFLLSCELLRRLSRSMSGLGFRVPPRTIQTAYKLLGATPWTNTLPFLIPINWTGLVVRSAPPVTLCQLALPFPCGSGAWAANSFHNIQRHCYNHRSYQWSDPRGPEQACLNEPLLADLCRHTSFGSLTGVILRNAGRTIRYRTLSCPWILL